MPIGDRYTNAPSLRVSLPTVTVRNAPHTARGLGGRLMPLTERERAARQAQRMTRTADVAGGFAVDPISGRNTVLSGPSSFFPPQLPPDFPGPPQSLRKKGEIYRHFYNTDPIVGQSIDLHTELPLSKVRLATPKP